MLVELSVVEQRYQAVLLVIHDGESVVEVARRFNVSRQTVHAWLARYERGGLAALADRSHRPRGCAHQMPAPVEAVVLEMRRINPDWGPRRLLHELDGALPSQGEVYAELYLHAHSPANAVSLYRSGTRVLGNLTELDAFARLDAAAASPGAGQRVRASAASLIGFRIVPQGHSRLPA